MTILLHPSSIGRIMGDAKSIDPALLDADTLVISKKLKKTDEDKAILTPLWDRTLSEGAKTYLRTLAKQIIYGVDFEVNVKYMRKGIACEQDGIDLLNKILFKRYVKNTIRIETDLMSGEADIVQPDYGRDIKVSWSLETFPATQEDAHDSGYEWQIRGYMNLFDKPLWYVDHLMVTTPEEMRKYEPANIHEVDHIDPELRKTTVSYSRDLDIERKMLIKCREAQKYCEQVQQRILTERGIS